MSSEEDEGFRDEEDEVESRARKALLDMWNWIEGRTYGFLAYTTMETLYSVYCSHCDHHNLDAVTRQMLLRALQSAVNYELEADDIVGIYEVPTEDEDEEEDDDDEDEEQDLD